MNKIFNKVPVEIHNKSGFDLSHQNLYTMKCGTLYPVLVDQLIPGDTVSLGHITEVQLPPMATDFYGRVQFKIEVFFCPNRLCYGGWQNFITHPVNDSYLDPANTVKYLPSLPIRNSQDLVRGSLADMLGLKNLFSTGTSPLVTIKNPLPFIAYHRIWNDWYRDSLLQNRCFTEPYNTSDTTDSAAYVPYVRYRGESPQILTDTLADGKRVTELRQRCFSKDYFTNAKLAPQYGTDTSLAFSVVDSQGSFTISSLRAANTIQKWSERQNLAGARYIEQIKANYGVSPSDAVLDRPVYLGSHNFDIYNKSVYKVGDSTDVSTNNPMTSVGTKFSSPLGVSDSSLVDKYTVSEFGYLFVIASIVPDALYSSGDRRYLQYQTLTDFANPILSAVGDQEIRMREISSTTLDADKTFGYTQRYSEYKFMLDEVHGELVDGSSLDSFALQRSFDSYVVLGSSFIEIPQNYMDQVTAVTADMSKYGAWANTYFKYKKSSVLPAYSIPTLGEPKDTHTEIINNGGIRL